MNGFELINKVREIEPGIKIIVVSGFAENQTKSKKRACHYLSKPVSGELLIEMAKMLTKCSEAVLLCDPEPQSLINKTGQDDWQCPLDCFDCDKNPKPSNIIQN